VSAPAAMALAEPSTSTRSRLGIKCWRTCGGATAAAVTIVHCQRAHATPHASLAAAWASKADGSTLKIAVAVAAAVEE
jgi:hypothetical protein